MQKPLTEFKNLQVVGHVLGTHDDLAVADLAKVGLNTALPLRPTPSLSWAAGIIEHRHARGRRMEGQQALAMAEP